MVTVVYVHETIRVMFMFCCYLAILSKLSDAQLSEDGICGILGTVLCSANFIG